MSETAMKLEEALTRAKRERENAEDSQDLYDAMGYLIEAVEANLEGAERENASLRLQMKALSENQVELMDALDAVKNSTHAMVKVPLCTS
jgi:hypothetical protein